MDYRLIALMLVPCLGYASYVALILSEIYRQKKYAHHIVLQNDAMEAIYGPMLPSIKAKEWFNIRILLTWIALGGVLFMCYWFRHDINAYIEFDFFDLIMGIYLTVVLLGIAAALWPLLIFKFAAEDPSSITGQAVLSSRLVAHQVVYQMAAFTILLIGIAAYQPSSFLLGSALVSLMVTFNCWRNIRRVKST